MKELTIEEKAKRYDETIEIAKKINNEQQAQPFNIMTRVFPELKESEDEKIRKELISYFTGWKDDALFRGIPHQKIIAWLERQDEKSILFTFDDVLALQCCMETVKKVQEDKELYNELLLLHNKVHDAYTITKR